MWGERLQEGCWVTPGMLGMVLVPYSKLRHRLQGCHWISELREVRAIVCSPRDHVAGGGKVNAGGVEEEWAVAYGDH